MGIPYLYQENRDNQKPQETTGKPQSERLQDPHGHAGLNTWHQIIFTCKQRMAIAKPGDYIRSGFCEEEGYMCDEWKADPKYYLIHWEGHGKSVAVNTVLHFDDLPLHTKVTVPCPPVPECKEARREL